MKYFYRVEHKDSKLGPYTHEFTETETLKLEADYDTDCMAVALGRRYQSVDLYNSYTHPSPYNYIPEFHDYDADALKFGFASPKLLFRWFTQKKSIWRFLRKYGFVVARYTYNYDSRMDGVTHSCIEDVNLNTREVLSDSWIDKYLRK